MMKLPSFTFKKDNTPKLSSLRPPIFRTDLLWFLALGLSTAILIITGTIGFKLFHDVYFESYKEDIPQDTFDNLINADRLKSVIEKRNEFINENVHIPPDPSL